MTDLNHTCSSIDVPGYQQWFELLEAGKIVNPYFKYTNKNPVFKSSDDS